MLVGYIVLVVSVFYVYNNISTYEKDLKNILLNQSISDIDDSSNKVLIKILKKSSNFINDNMTNAQLREENEIALSVLVTRNIRSLYIVFPIQDKLYYLLDTAKIDKGEAGELFLPAQAHYFRKVKITQEHQTFIQDKMTDLGYTLIKPIVENNKTIAFLVVDYTKNSLSALASLLKLSVHIIFISLAIGMIFLLLLFVYILRTSYMKHQIYKNPKTNTFYRTYLSDNYEKIDFTKYYIALADIDFFKRVNNLYGQENGDKVITSIIKQIAGMLGEDDMFIQYGGEEFLLFFAKKNLDDQRFKHKLEDIRIMIERLNIYIEKDTLKLTLSIGALINTEVARSLQDAIQKADTALYECKHNGRNSIRYFDITQKKRLYREKLKEMIDGDKLVCYYQPIRSLESGKLHHYEALLRIEDGKNIIFPDKILPDLEDSYLYSRLTMKVIEYNLVKLRQDENFKISINLSADDLVNDSVLEVLAQNADLSDRMLIEILENKSIDYQKVEFSIQKLKLFGYQICIDDFGSGYSNLNHLLNLSIDYLKIDGSIIKEIAHDKKAYSIVKTFALFCQQNDIHVIAEYIDHQETVDILKSFGIEYGQGFYFSKAKPYQMLSKSYL